MDQNDLLGILLDMRSGQVAADCNQKFNDVLAGLTWRGDWR